MHRQLRSFQVLQNLLRPFRHLFRQSRHLRNLNAVRVIGETRCYLVKKDHLVPVLAHFHFVILDAGKQIRKLVQLVIMRCKQRPCAHAFVQVLRERPGDADAVERAGAAPNLIQQNQTPFRRSVDNVRRLVHLDEKRTFARRNVVACANACINLVHQPNNGFLRRNKASYLCQQHNKPRHPQVTRLAAHIRAGDDQDLVRLNVEHDVVRRVLVTRRQQLLNHRMPAIHNLQCR